MVWFVVVFSLVWGAGFPLGRFLVSHISQSQYMRLYLDYEDTECSKTKYPVLVYFLISNTDDELQNNPS